MSFDGGVLMPPPQIYVERTLAIIKPDVMKKAAEIEDILLRSGFTVLQKRRVRMTPEQASEFYSDHYGKIHFGFLLGYMCSSSIWVLSLARHRAISYLLHLVGPTDSHKARLSHPESLRAVYGTDQFRNAIHASDSFSNSQKEIHFFFPDSIIEPVPMAQAAEDYLSKVVNPTLFKGLVELCKMKPANPVIWLADWLMENNPYKPKIDPVLVLTAQSRQSQRRRSSQATSATIGSSRRSTIVASDTPRIAVPSTFKMI